MELVAAFPWNRWQVCYGIDGNFHAEYAAVACAENPRLAEYEKWGL